MSDTKNEYEDTGANYPDAEGEPGAEERDTPPGDGPDEPAAPPQPGTQTEPAQDVHTTTDGERLDGIVAQVRADVSGENAAVVEKALRARLDDTGIALGEDEISTLVAEISA